MSNVFLGTNHTKFQSKVFNNFFLIFLSLWLLNVNSVPKIVWTFVSLFFILFLSECFRFCLPFSGSFLYVFFPSGFPSPLLVWDFRCQWRLSICPDYDHWSEQILFLILSVSGLFLFILSESKALFCDRFFGSSALSDYFSLLCLFLLLQVNGDWAELWATLSVYLRQCSSNKVREREGKKETPGSKATVRAVYFS